MAYRVKVVMKPTSVIEANLGIETGGRVHKFFTNECYKAMDKYVPMDTGDLRSVVSMSLDGRYITYEMPYATYQYYGSQNGKKWNYTTPGTGPYWDKVMWTAEGQDIVKRVQKYMEEK